MDPEFKKLTKKIDRYFSETSDDQLRVDVEKAGYEFYRNINIQIFSDCISTEKFTFSMEGIKTKSIHRGKTLVFDGAFTPDNYPFNFKVAA